MTNNPYAAPEAEIAAEAGTCPIYSPNQVAAGAFVGGPVGLIYFLRENFLTLGNVRQARQSLLWGVVLIVALLVILPWLPDRFPSFPITIGYMIIGQQVANKYQLTRSAIAESPRYIFDSNWRVFGCSLLCLIGSVIVIFAPMFLIGVIKASHGV